MVGSEDTRSSGLSDPLALDTLGPHPFRWLPVVPPLVEAPAPPPPPPLLDEVSSACSASNVELYVLNSVYRADTTGGCDGAADCG